MEFQIWSKLDNDGRAPEEVTLEDYEFGGELEASSPKDVVRRLSRMDDESEFTGVKSLKPGDVLIDETGNSVILTEVGLWAQCVVVDYDEEIVDTTT